MDKEEIARVNANFRLAAIATIIILIGGVIFYQIVEKLSLIDALYFSVITLTTVGYGDITPQTAIGKLFTSGYVIVGIGIIGTFANLLLKRQMIKRNTKLSAKKTTRE